MSNSDFSGDDYEFAAGSIKGMRSWSIDDQGRLRGVTYPALWKPGENTATCRKTPEREPCPKRGELKVDVKQVSCGCGCGEMDEARTYSTCGEEGCWRGTHPAGQRHAYDAECSCGFWAYDEHSFEEYGDVTGIVEAWGKVTIGTKGFRAEKAKVVALCRGSQDLDRELSLSVWLRLQQLYPAADFYDERDDMVTAHGAVLRNWDQPGEDFWVDDDEQPQGSVAFTFAPSFTLLRQALSAYVPPPSASSIFKGLQP